MEISSLTSKAAPVTPPPTVPEPGQTDQIPVWPMKVGDFLAGSWLEPADIILSRKHGDLASKVIRWVTKSHFSHAALIYATPHWDANYNNTFVIEAGTHGVNIANLTRYVNDERSVSAVRRLNQPWFGREVQGRVRGLVLNHIDAGYDYGAIVRILQNLWFQVKRSVRGHKGAVKSYTPKGHMAPTRFICSGFVQIGFVEAVAELVLAGKLPRAALKDAVFTAQGIDGLPDNFDALPAADLKPAIDHFQDDVEDLLEAVTPQDLSKSEQLEWRYVIRDGLVYRVTNYQEASKLLYWKAKQPDLTPDVASASPAA